ncbi:MAG: alpha/beta fold hydrolase [Gemmatimonadaceae bacterium]|nr:alpha/beta fold hydrolase [Gemmatimonadaceae bacterium]
MSVVATTATLVAVGTAVAAQRVYRGQQRERAFDARFSARRNADGIIAGAEGFQLSGTSDRAIVLLHGYNDSPQTMRSPAAAMHAAGWSVYAPLLPGHGRSLPAFAASRAEQWIDAAHEAVQGAVRAHQRVAVGGLSLGCALSTIMAAEHPEVRAAVLFSPFLVESWRLTAIATLWPVFNLGAKYIGGNGAQRSIRDAAARASLIAYGCSPPRLMREVQQVARRAHDALPRVRQPVWMAQSSDDYRIPVDQAQRAFDRMASTDKRLHWTTGNGHVITVDFGHEELAAEGARWIESRVPAR